MPARLDWSSAVGHFILNFGILDLHVQDFLESKLAPAEFGKLRVRNFQDRVERMKKLLGQSELAPENKRAINQFSFAWNPSGNFEITSPTVSYEWAWPKIGRVGL